MINIIKGEDKDIIVRLGSRSTGDPYDLTAATPITCCFLNADKTFLTLGLATGIAITTALLGKLTLTLTAAQTALLAEVANATLELSITKSSKIVKVQIPKAYSVVAKVC
jgi:hypothetical protein